MKFGIVRRNISCAVTPTSVIPALSRNGGKLERLRTFANAPTVASDCLSVVYRGGFGWM
ncbi:hypothetical protein AGRHK599_LOCUS3098 [Rhizobium rhizogenes]|uniref:Uncharacterized protein n=1 Tax=Rhizobium rhizogenes TaxID=359 RepID=A0AAN2A5A6_RHIRH|nr:hypothetical protein AGRHK599_LOCUS3098 [Rhizobium rhizogenes]